MAMSTPALEVLRKHPSVWEKGSQYGTIQNFVYSGKEWFPENKLNNTKSEFRWGKKWLTFKPQSSDLEMHRHSQDGGEKVGGRVACFLNGGNRLQLYRRFGNYQENSDSEIKVQVGGGHHQSLSSTLVFPWAQRQSLIHHCDSST